MEVSAPSKSIAGPSNPGVSENSLHKNHLQEYTQRSSIHTPIYHTINEGSPHLPRYRSTVMVDGAAYRASRTFLHRKAAEQYVAKVALDCISRKLKDEGCPLISKDTTFCKSILNEYAAKMKLEMPKYGTSQSEGLLPVFVSTLVFDGKTYTGVAGRNKKEAEQMAARTVIQFILGNSGFRTTMYEIIKSKIKLYRALHKVTYEAFPTGQPSLVPISNPSVSELKKPMEKKFNEIDSGSSDNETLISNQPLSGNDAHFNPTRPLHSTVDLSLVTQATSLPAQMPNASSTPIVVPLLSQTKDSEVNTLCPLVPPASPGLSGNETIISNQPLSGNDAHFNPTRPPHSLLALSVPQATSLTTQVLTTLSTPIGVPLLAQTEDSEVNGLSPLVPAACAINCASEGIANVGGSKHLQRKNKGKASAVSRASQGSANVSPHSPLALSVPQATSLPALMPTTSSTPVGVPLLAETEDLEVSTLGPLVPPAPAVNCASQDNANVVGSKRPQRTNKKKASAVSRDSNVGGSKHMKNKGKASVVSCDSQGNANEGGSKPPKMKNKREASGVRCASPDKANVGGSKRLSKRLQMKNMRKASAVSSTSQGTANVGGSKRMLKKNKRKQAKRLRIEGQ